MGWNEWPLMLFTVIAQSCMGAFWWCCFALVAGGLAPEQRSRLDGLMLVIWGMMAIGFAFSAFHLGSPRRGINAIFRFGRSPLSNEIVFGNAFATFGFLAWLMTTFNLGTATMQIIVLSLSLACSLAFLWNMALFYMMPTVPTWNTPLTPAAFLLTAIIGGSAVAATLFSAAGIGHSYYLNRGPLSLACLAFIAIIVVTLFQSAALPNINSSIKRAAALSPHYAALMTLRFVFLFSALSLWLKESLQSGTLSFAMGVLCVALIMVGEMVGRGVFYALHMTEGLS